MPTLLFQPWMEDRETPRMGKYGESKTTRIMVATVRHVTAWAGRTKYQADWLFFDRVYLFIYVILNFLYIWVNFKCDRISSSGSQCCRVHFAVLFINLISADVILDLSDSLIVQFSHPHNKVGNVKVLYIFSIACFWTWEDFKFLLIIPIIWRNFDILPGISISLWYEKEKLR